MTGKHWKKQVFLVAVVVFSWMFYIYENQEELTPRIGTMMLDHVVVDHDPVLFIDTTHFYVRWGYGEAVWEMNETIPTKQCPNPRLGELEDVQYITHHYIHMYAPDYYTTLGARVFCEPHKGP